MLIFPNQVVRKINKQIRMDHFHMNHFSKQATFKAIFFGNSLSPCLLLGSIPPSIMFMNHPLWQYFSSSFSAIYNKNTLVPHQINISPTTSKLSMASNRKKISWRNLEKRRKEILPWQDRRYGLPVTLPADESSFC